MSKSPRAKSKATSTKAKPARKKSKATPAKSSPTRSTGADTVTQFVVPAVVGAVIAPAAIMAFLTFGPTPVSSPSGKMAAMDKGQKAAIEQTIREYLLNNPQLLMEMSAALEKQQAETQNLQVKTAISQNANIIFRDNYGLEAGNPSGDVTIVEFSDYNCPYCKRAFSTVLKMIDSDKKIRFVFKEFPIFGERSEAVARVAIAAEAQGKYFEMHAELMKNRGQTSEQKALLLAEKLGLDMDRLKQDMASDETRKIIKDTSELGNKLGIRGTPFYLVGDHSIPGAPDDLYQVFQKHAADIRKNGCEAVC